ncbi:MAG TPA: gamma-glutamyltransferase [Gemmatimonadaceae bacterium]|nr:gamma-glutamyltransferase [Gemmatimonadaceae bacterium]
MRYQSFCVAGAAAAVALLFTPAHAARQEAPPPVPSTSGMVVSVNGYASDIGAAILAKGGNAVDAAVATGFALAVVHPAAGNLGGGGFMVVRLPGGTSTTFDYREKAPLKSTRTMYLDSAGNIVRALTNTGYLAPGVPGTVKGLAMAHAKFGKLKWQAVVSPAADLAEQGFVLSEPLARSINGELERMRPYPQSVRAYGKPGGGTWAGGDTMRLADLGRALRSIANEGPSAFYRGWIADSIEATMKAGGGIITKRDLAVYSAKERRPVRGRYRGYEIISMPPPSSGGIALIEMLNILEQYDLAGMGHGSAKAMHLITEAQRRAYLDRARFLGDPDFVDIPVARLTSKGHAKSVAASIDLDRATSSAELGKDILTKELPPESDQTTHFSVVDRNGMAVSNTYTLEGSYGSHVVVSGAGFILNNEMGDFNKKPGYTDTTGTIGTRANLIAPGKRMLSSMTPTIVAKDGRLFLVTGSPGGRTIINTTLHVILNSIDFGMDVRQAVNAPRQDSEWMPDVVGYERNGLADSVVKTLEAMGHRMRERGTQGDAHSIRYDPKTKTAWGANDLRTPDSKVSRP